MKIDCQTMSERLLDYIYEEVEDEEHSALEAHLEDCEACREESRALSSTRAMMSNLEEDSPSRDDSFVMAAARRHAREVADSEKSPGLLARFGSWLEARPGLVAVPMAAVVVVLVVGVTLGDEIRSLFGASADALAGEETAIAPQREGPERFLLGDRFEERAWAADERPRVETDLSQELEAAAPSRPEPAPRGEATVTLREEGPPPAARRPERQRRARPLPAETTGDALQKQARTARGRAAPSSSIGLPRDLAEDSQVAGAPSSATPAPPPPARASRPPSSSMEGSATKATRDLESPVMRRSRAAPPREAQAEHEEWQAYAEDRSEALFGAGPGAHAEQYAEAGDLAEDMDASPPSIQEIRRAFAYGRCREVVSMVDRFPDTSGDVAAEAHVLKARCLERLGRRDEALEAWRAALDASPEGRHSDAARRALGE